VLSLLSSVVRGYHVYHNIWDALVGEEVSYQREEDNYADPFAIAAVKNKNIVDHVPRKIFKCVLTIFASRRFDWLSCNW